MPEKGSGGASRKRFSGDGNSGTSDCTVWTRWVRAALESRILLASLCRLISATRLKRSTADAEAVDDSVPVLLTQGCKELDIKAPHWHTREGKRFIEELYKKKFTWLVEDTAAWVLVSFEQSRLLRSSVPYRVLQLSLVLTVRKKVDGLQDVKCPCTLQGFPDPNVLDFVRGR